MSGLLLLTQGLSVTSPHSSSCHPPFLIVRAGIQRSHHRNILNCASKYLLHQWSEMFLFYFSNSFKRTGRMQLRLSMWKAAKISSSFSLSWYGNRPLHLCSLLPAYYNYWEIEIPMGENSSALLHIMRDKSHDSVNLKASNMWNSPWKAIYCPIIWSLFKETFSFTWFIQLTLVYNCFWISCQFLSCHSLLWPVRVTC